MSGFSADWLDLREPIDHAARSVALTDAVAARLSGVLENSGGRPLRVVDLGCGTGSNTRYLVPRLGPLQHWTAVDADTGLLAAMPVRTAAWASGNGLACVETPDALVVSGASLEARLRPVRGDISRFPIDALSGRPHLISASALLDLVSEAWLEGCVSACVDARACGLFALSYDGRTAIAPSHADDGLVLALVNAHQRGDKGFGPALGPEATACAAHLFAQAGYEVQRAPSDWQVGPDAWRLQRELLGGWAVAAAEMAPEQQARISAWTIDRQAACEARALHVVVGHEDLAAWPRASPL